MNTFPQEIIERYFRDRLAGKPLRGKQSMVECPFHDDGSASLSLNLEKGVWKCHAGCGEGGILAFEKLFSQCDDGTAWLNISEVTGYAPTGPRPEKVYVYEDEYGRPLFRVVRYPRDEQGKKSFRQHKFNGKAWDDNLADARRVLYHLPEVITANEVLIVEGEKDADNLRSLDLAAGRPEVKVTATTAPGGSSAGTWKSEFSPFLTGKRVFILPDNDQPGREHAERVAQSVSKYAVGVKIVSLPGLQEKGDASDFLQNHSKEEFIEALRAAKTWAAPKDEAGEDKFFVGAMRLAQTVPDEIDWMVKGIIPFGWNGFVVADPKSLKSFSAINLMLHLALGKNWMGMEVPRRVKVAMLAREDYWGLTGWRIKHFVRGMVQDNNVTPVEIDSINDWMIVNTQQQESSWLLNEDADVERVIRLLAGKKTEFLMMDVFRVLFSGEENDSKEMQIILDRIKRIRNEVGCGIGIVHHANKNATGDIFQRARGSTTIHGFMEWGMGITTENPDADRNERVRKMEFLTKAGNEPEPFHIKAEGGEDEGWIKLVRTEYQKPTRRKKPSDVVGSLPYKDGDE